MNADVLPDKGRSTQEDKNRETGPRSRYDMAQTARKERIFSFKLYLAPITELADKGFGSPGRRKSVARLTCPFRLCTTRATSPADWIRVSCCSDAHAYRLPSAL
jgi:hypothetical protein